MIPLVLGLLILCILILCTKNTKRKLILIKVFITVLIVCIILNITIKTEKYIFSGKNNDLKDANELSGYFTCNIASSCILYHVKKDSTTELQVPQTSRVSGGVRTIDFKIQDFKVGDKLKIVAYLLKDENFLSVFNWNGKQYFTNSKHPPQVPLGLNLNNPTLVSSVSFSTPIKNRRIIVFQPL